MDAEGVKSILAPSALPQGRQPDIEVALSAPLDLVHINTLELMREYGRPLTLREIARLTGLSQQELQAVIQELRELHLVKGLNTVIVSYIATSATVV